MRMRRPELWLSPDPFLSTTLLLFLPFVELRPETDSARKIETRVCHQQKADVIRLSFSESGQCERYKRGYRDRNKKNNGFREDIGEEGKTRKWLCEILVGQANELCFRNMTRNYMSDFMAQDGSQFVIVADYMVEEAAGDQDEAGPKDASAILI